MSCGRRVNPAAKLPTRGTDNAAAMDLHACEDGCVPATGKDRVAKINVGIQIASPNNHFSLIKSRSSIALKGANVCGGVMDQDYRGDLRVIMNSTGSDDLGVQER